MATLEAYCEGYGCYDIYYDPLHLSSALTSHFRRVDIGADTGDGVSIGKVGSSA
jgi:hypothetical protein